MSTTLPLHNMIRSVIAGATEKLAADEGKSKKVQELISYEKKEHGGHIPSVHEEEVEDKEHEKKASASYTDPMYIEKLASAVDHIAENVDSIEVTEPGPIAQALAKTAAEETKGSPAGPGKRPGALEIKGPTPGRQSYKKDHPATEDAAESEHGSPLSTAGKPGGKTQLENNMHKAPGNNSGEVPKTEYPEKGPLVNLKKTAEEAKEHILLKLAGEDVLKANISAPKTANPLAGKGQLESMKGGDAPPKASGGPTSGFGNQARDNISSNQKAIDYTKKDAKGPVKSQLAEVLDEPALSPKTDTTLKNNLRNTGKAGVKIAAARTLFAKVAAAGCTCGGKGECEFDLLKEAANRAKQKTANMGMGGGMGAPAPMGAGGGGMGMGAMAEAGAGADGCTCGNAGECRVCKLKAELAAAKAMGIAPQGAVPGGGAPATGHGAPEKDAMGAYC